MFAILPFQLAAMSNSAAVDQAQRLLAVNLAPYKAQLRSHGGKPKEIVPASYDVYLFAGHSLEQHSKAVKANLTPHILYVWCVLMVVVSSAQNVDENLVAAVHSDPRVEAVRYVHNDYAE